VDVTTAELLEAVGLVLQQKRLKLKWTVSDVEKNDGPSYKTVQTIEDGKSGQFESLDKCAHALGIEIVDVLYSVLESRVKPLSPEAAMVVRVFNETTVDMRTAFVALANAAKAVQAAAAATELPPPASGEPTPPTPRPPRSAPKATRRRTAR
jgi:hypothetical protein